MKRFVALTVMFLALLGSSILLLNAQTKTAKRTLSDDPNYRKFTGATDKRFYGGNKSMCGSLAARVRSYRRINYNLPKFNGQTVPKPEVEIVIVPVPGKALVAGTPFEQLMIAAVDPESQNKNIYVRITNEPPGDGDPRSYQKRLEDDILASKGNLTPAAVMGMALQATKGNYPLAALTAHNLLKEITYGGRQATTKLSGLITRGGNYSFPAEYGEVASKLINLRDKPGDKMGIWYHAFVPLAITAWTDNPRVADTSISQEYAVRRLGKLTNMGSPVDPEKEASDECFAAAARSIYDQKPQTSGIQVVAGTYGENCNGSGYSVKHGNVTADLAGACNGLANCKYKVDYTKIGDPAFGCRKHYQAEWRCGNSPSVQSAESVILPDQHGEAGYGSIVKLTCGSQ